MALQKFHWEVTPAPDVAAVEQLQHAFDIPAAGARLLAARGMSTVDAARTYLFSDDAPLHDPFQFRNMGVAVERLQAAIDNQKKVLIHGDYDVDGICGTALLYHFLKGLVPDVFRFVPDRRKDGYGLATRAVEWAIAEGIGLFIAVDCGTSDGALVAQLEEAGIDVVICDHHELPVGRDVRGVLLNPVAEYETYPFRGLCGTGVAFKLLEALEARGVRGHATTRELVDLFAVATVGDVAPLTGENRTLVRAGLRQINGGSARVGLQSLRTAAGIEAPVLNATHIGFSLAPRINAPGRIANPKPALEILCETNRRHAGRLAARLESDNEIRRGLTDRVRDEVMKRIEAMDDGQRRAGFVIAGADWDEGVLGIAAARVVEEFGRPAILITQSGGVAKGSGRSVPGVHLKEQLDRVSSHLLKFGGHAQAVGFSIAPASIPAFADELTGRLREATETLPARPRLRIDTGLALDDCSLDLVDFLSLCEPFGYGNRTPVWHLPNVTIAEQTRVVRNGHLKLRVVGEKGASAEAISFGWESRKVPVDDLHGRRVDLAVKIRHGYFQKKHYAEIHVVDMRDAGEA